ncbi:SMC family ATPase [Phytoactinopolyspora alkaliphila]|uniref:Nuclease SbcCD subunit C n=1 Tax=Phytoactinopolyspora alkaliphila TaxID=1783498 RepID=A0A6N9YL53_9ACTN|nr:SMC family ATPase [Phytoactinopolyspora alkaliphila]NED95578.1 SMC family ATPase [Phytoactinopolyspora alkaliphila]
MQLHTLTFAALGPFRDQQHIDFGELTAGGLFLLDGPTGAGKSTIIDAVVFALYGQVAGGNSSKYRLVSDHRDLGTEPFVDLVFETGRGVYRVRRTPEYQRPKKRGEGTVTQQASVKLWRGTSPAGVAGDPLSTRAGEADDEIRDALGLSREQFVKTVVLPQGEFARFLQSRSDERRDILQSIFGTEHFESIQAELKRRRADMRKECDDADARLRFAVESFAYASGIEGASDTGTQLVDQVLSAVTDQEDETEAALIGWADEIIAGLAGSYESLTTQCAQAEAARAEAGDRLSDLEQRQSRRDRLRTALAEKEQLEAARDHHDEADRRLDAGRRAATCRSAIDALDAVNGRLERARSRVEVLRATVELPGIDVTTAEQAAIASAHRELLDTVVGLNDMLKLEADLPPRRDELTSLTDEHAKLQKNLASIEARSEALPRQIEMLEEQSAAAREVAAALPSLRAERRTVEELAGVHQDLLDARHERESADSRRRATLRMFTKASETEADLRRRYLEGVAAELAEKLVPRKPCQVCGSVKHPKPAQRMLDHVDRESVDAAEQARIACQQDLDACVEAFSQAATRVAELEGRLDGRTAQELRQRLAELDAAIADAEAAEQSTTTLNHELIRRRQEQQTCREQQGKAIADIAAVDARLASRTEAVDRDAARVSEARLGFPSVASRVSDLKRRAEAASQLMTALAELARYTEDHASRTSELRQAISSAGFASIESVRDALLPDNELADLHRLVNEWRRRMDAVEGRLAEPDLVGIDPDAHLDVEAARAAFAAHEAELTALRQRATTSHDRLNRSRDCRDRLVKTTRHRRAQHDKAAPAIRIAGLANADSPDNATRTPLATYVLQRVFDSVVEAANERLVEMSAGRYTLEAHDGKQHGTRRTGLGLRVIDAHTGHGRETETLSGGETFYVSLSLALGLADVVTAQAGGLRMGTLFIDEGFGSLDPETLDHVMGVLSALRSGGRVVGVVSHVEELKTRIPERIDVRRTSVGGPSTLAVVA